MFIFRLAYLKNNRIESVMLKGSNPIQIINRFFKTSYRDQRAFDHWQLVSISKFKRV